MVITPQRRASASRRVQAADDVRGVTLRRASDAMEVTARGKRVVTRGAVCAMVSDCAATDFLSTVRIRGLTSGDLGGVAGGRNLWTTGPFAGEWRLSEGHYWSPEPFYELLVLWEVSACREVVAALTTDSPPRVSVLPG
ncbi:hypothetical protein GCM10022205_46540 [Spinactinospora alkalitolerans]